MGIKTAWLPVREYLYDFRVGLIAIVGWWALNLLGYFASNKWPEAVVQIIAFVILLVGPYLAYCNLRKRMQAKVDVLEYDKSELAKALVGSQEALADARTVKIPADSAIVVHNMLEVRVDGFSALWALFVMIEKHSGYSSDQALCDAALITRGWGNNYDNRELWTPVLEKMKNNGLVVLSDEKRAKQEGYVDRVWVEARVLYEGFETWRAAKTAGYTRDSLVHHRALNAKIDQAKRFEAENAQIAAEKEKRKRHQ